MSISVDQFAPLLLELDQLKAVNRQTYTCGGERRENSAEHSWHLATALLALAPVLPEELDLNKAIQLALLHDVCEIGAGDISVHHEGRNDIAEKEEAYLEELRQRSPEFGSLAYDSRQQNESNETLESQWVKVLDRLLPMLLNLATEGRLWQESGTTLSMVRRAMAPVEGIAPEVHSWIVQQAEQACDRGWLARD